MPYVLSICRAVRVRKWLGGASPRQAASAAASAAEAELPHLSASAAAAATDMDGSGLVKTLTNSPQDLERLHQARLKHSGAEHGHRAQQAKDPKTHDAGYHLCRLLHSFEGVRPLFTPHRRERCWIRTKMTPVHMLVIC